MRIFATIALLLFSVGASAQMPPPVYRPLSPDTCLVPSPDYDVTVSCDSLEECTQHGQRPSGCDKLIRRSFAPGQAVLVVRPPDARQLDLALQERLFFRACTQSHELKPCHGPISSQNVQLGLTLGSMWTSRAIVQLRGGSVSTHTVYSWSDDGEIEIPGEWTVVPLHVRSSGEDVPPGYSFPLTLRTDGFTVTIEPSRSALLCHSIRWAKDSRPGFDGSELVIDSKLCPAAPQPVRGVFYDAVAMRLTLDDPVKFMAADIATSHSMVLEAESLGLIRHPVVSETLDDVSSGDAGIDVSRFIRRIAGHPRSYRLTVTVTTHRSGKYFTNEASQPASFHFVVKR
jgi:hypothetical protein